MKKTPMALNAVTVKNNNNNPYVKFYTEQILKNENNDITIYIHYTIYQETQTSASTHHSVVPRIIVLPTDIDGDDISW